MATDQEIEAAKTVFLENYLSLKPHFDALDDNIASTRSGLSFERKQYALASPGRREWIKRPGLLPTDETLGAE
jgi:hypothetical protein